MTPGVRRRATLRAIVALTIGVASVAWSVTSDAARAPWAERVAEAFPPLGAMPDSTLEQFLEGLADSTSDYFGAAAARPDTTGLDSARAFGLAHPQRLGRMRFSYHPDFSFNRVDGPVYTLAAGYGFVRTLGELRAEGSYAAGPNDVLWRTRYAKTWGGILARRTRWHLDIGGGLETKSMDRERTSVRLTTARAFMFGKDSHNYLRREGWTVGLRREHAFGQFGISYSDMDESSITTTTGWNLTHRHLSRFDNLAAFEGRVHEVEFITDFDLYPLPIQTEVLYQTSGSAIGSDFEYRRARIAAGGDLGLGHWATVVPQVVYGRLTQQPVPQAAFYLGGSRSVRSLASGERGGTGYALGRIEVLGAFDVLQKLHLPHPAFLPLQLGAFTAAGAVWGVDPFGGPTRDGTDWPRSGDWVSEAGVSIIYQPGIPDPTSLLRVNYAWPLGPARESTTFSIAFTRALDFLRRFER